MSSQPSSSLPGASLPLFDRLDEAKGGLDMLGFLDEVSLGFFIADLACFDLAIALALASVTSAPPKPIDRLSPSLPCLLPIEYLPDDVLSLIHI